MSTKTRRFVAESFDDAPVEVGTEHEATIGQICEDLAVDHTELCQLLDQAQAVKAVADEFPEEKVLTISEERFLSAFVGMATAGMGVTVEQLKVFKETPEGKALSLEAFEGGIWETIKRVIKAIVDKIMQFWNWLTGNSKKVEAKQDATKKKLESASEEKLEKFRKDVDEVVKQGSKLREENVSKEDFEFTPSSAPHVHRISAARLVQYTDKVPTGGLVFVDNVIDDVGKQMSFGRKLRDALRRLGGDITEAEHPEVVISKVAKNLEDTSRALGIHEGGEVRLVGSTYLVYDPKNLHFSLETKSIEVDHAKNYIISFRSPREVVTAYTNYVRDYRADFDDTETKNLKELADQMNRVKEMIRPDIPEYQNHPHEAQRAIGVIVHAQSVLLSALARLTHVAATLESSLMSWVPSAA